MENDLFLSIDASRDFAAAAFRWVSVLIFAGLVLNNWVVSAILVQDRVGLESYRSIPRKFASIFEPHQKIFESERSRRGRRRRKTGSPKP